jgi:hypothetical protein
MMTVYGYARVSTDGQTLDARRAALKAAGAEKVYGEKQSGATAALVSNGPAISGSIGSFKLIASFVETIAEGFFSSASFFKIADEIEILVPRSGYDGIGSVLKS